MTSSASAAGSSRSPSPITIPGLIFILLGPITGGKVGLQFAIDFTGGTVWTIRFEDANVTADQVKAVLDEQGDRGERHPDRRRVHGDPDQGRGARAPRRRRRRRRPPHPSGARPSAAPLGLARQRRRRPARPRRPALGRRSPSAVGRAALASPSPSAEPGRRPRRRGLARCRGAAPSPAPGRLGGVLPTQGKLGEVRFALEEELGPIAEQQSLSTVGAVVSSDLITQALILILVGSIGIMLWITYRFRDFQMGVTALVALLHDVLVVVGIFAILGTFVGLQIDGLFVTAMLTVIGFSVHDTIVVFDRVRENRARHAGEPFDRIVNHSILQTFGRSITTSLTVVITLLALLLFAGDAIGTFVLALLHRHHLRHLLLDLQREPAPRRVARVG